MSEKQVIIDHIGFRAANEADYLSIIEALAQVDLHGVQSQAEGHTRTFFELGNGVRLEVQLWDADLPQRRSQMIHLDVQADDPMATLRQVNPNAQDWGVGEVPRGGTKVTQNEQFGFMIMARPKN